MEKVTTWKEIDGFPNYQVSDEGQVRNVKTSRILKGSNCGKGYLAVGLYLNKRRHTRKIHRLVLEAFISKRPPNKQCCHYDGNPQNNNINNLKWGTAQDNTDDRTRHGTNIVPRGSKHGNAKLTEDIVRECKLLYNQGRTQTSLAEIYGVSQSQISAAITGRTWSHVK